MNSNVLDISKYVIKICIKNNTPISNLQLQKILYYIQGNFLAIFDKEAFSEDIVAWKHGPVVLDAYYEYNHNVARKITDYEDVQLSMEPEEMELIKEITLKKCKMSAWELVNETHRERPWVEIYRDEFEGRIIPKSLMFEYFKSIQKVS